MYTQKYTQMQKAKQEAELYISKIYFDIFCSQFFCKHVVILFVK